MRTKDLSIMDSNGNIFTTSCILASALQMGNYKLSQIIQSLSCDESVWENNFRKRTYPTDKGNLTECFDITKTGFQLLVPELRSEENDGVLAEIFKDLEA